MGQEAWVLKCYSCAKFQVQLQKKAKKWQCKVCGSKQDLMTIFYKGQPSDCRNNCRKMNADQGKMNEEGQNLISQDNIYNDQSLLENHNYLNNSTENLMQEAVDLDDQFLQIEETDFQESFLHKNFKETNEHIEQRNSEPTEKEFSKTNERLNITDSHNSCNSSSQVLKMNIFESHSDFEESLDF